jgi:Fungal specific transcription factor domain
VHILLQQPKKCEPILILHPCKDCFEFVHHLSDVQSLHNRVLILEAQLSQLTSGRMKLSSHDLDHALLAVGSSGSSVLVPVDDVAGVWLEHVDIGRDCGVDFQPAFLGMSNESESHDRRDHTRPEASPCSRGDSVHSSPHPASSAAVSSPLSIPHLHLSSPSVTPALLALLPSARQRPILLDVLGSVLRMHPSLNFPHFRARIATMFVDGSSPGEIGIGPSRADHTEKPTLTFFAAVTAGFALAIQCSSKHGVASSSHASQTPASPALYSPPSVSSLLTLSAQVLNLVEDTMPYDLDFLHALTLRCLCMLHDGMPRVNQAVFTTVGKMVNIARLMGLARDPDEFTCGPAAKYTLWEAEMRRRMWWDVFYYDL